MSNLPDFLTSIIEAFEALLKGIGGGLTGFFENITSGSSFGSSTPEAPVDDTPEDPVDDTPEDPVDDTPEDVEPEVPGQEPLPDAATNPDDPRLN